MKLYTKLLLAIGIIAVASCATPKDIAYLQDIKGETSIKADKAEPIRLKPMDQISIIVNSRDPQVTAMFNLPYYSNRIGQTQSMSDAMTSGGASSSQGMSGYTVDSQGYIDFPVLGLIQVGGLTREEVTEKIKEELLDSRQIKDPVVTVEFMNLGFAVLGEVTRPGRYKIDRDRFTVLDALALAGDLTINGRRSDVMLIRHDGNKDHAYYLNLLDSKELYASPAFYVEQGDVIYVTPNDKRMRESTVNGNNVRSASFWFSLASLLTSTAVLVLRFVLP
ncbi:MAG: polysaccharide biosynthesis/export family protein [Bacteroidales bacterium]|nr:polysaccharide biosynthesis/export family protein [Bacteroidales bacterium]